MVAVKSLTQYTKQTVISDRVTLVFSVPNRGSHRPSALIQPHTPHHRRPMPPRPVCYTPPHDYPADYSHPVVRWWRLLHGSRRRLLRRWRHRPYSGDPPSLPSLRKRPRPALRRFHTHAPPQNSVKPPYRLSQTKRATSAVRELPPDPIQLR